MDEKGQTFLIEQWVEIPALKESMTKMKASEPELGVVVKGANEVGYQHMINVLDVLQQLEITKVGLCDTGRFGEMRETFIDTSGLLLTIPARGWRTIFEKFLRFRSED